MKTQSGNQLNYSGGAINSINSGSGTELFLDYNFLDQPRLYSGSSGTVSFHYDGEGQRQRKISSGVDRSYIWMGSEILREDWGPATIREYLLGNGREGMKQDGQWYFYHKDHLGSTILMTDAGGNVVGEWDYSAYGKHTFVSPPNAVAEANPFLYAGQQLDPETGQYYMRARYYDPLYGRFLVRDPIRHSGGNNLYAYTSNNPINFTDSTGLDEDDDSPSSHGFPDFDIPVRVTQKPGGAVTWAAQVNGHGKLYLNVGLDNESFLILDVTAHNRVAGHADIDIRVSVYHDSDASISGEGQRKPPEPIAKDKEHFYSIRPGKTKGHRFKLDLPPQFGTKSAYIVELEVSNFSARHVQHSPRKFVERSWTQEYPLQERRRVRRSDR